MEGQIVVTDSEKDGYSRVGVFTVENGLVSVAYLGSFPMNTTQLGGHAKAPAALARVLLREFKEN